MADFFLSGAVCKQDTSTSQQAQGQNLEMGSPNSSACGEFPGLNSGRQGLMCLWSLHRSLSRLVPSVVGS